MAVTFLEKKLGRAFASRLVSAITRSRWPWPFRHRAVTQLAPEHSAAVTWILRFLGKKQHWRVASNAKRIVRRLQTRNLVSFCHIDLSSWPTAVTGLSPTLIKKLAGPFGRRLLKVRFKTRLWQPGDRLHKGIQKRSVAAS